MNLSSDQRQLLEGQHGEAAAMAMRILVAMARAAGVDAFVAITSAHIDGCLFHGPTGAYFAERLQSGNARVRVPTSLNVGAMDLLRPANVRLEGRSRELAVRQMNAYVAMGCTPSWTCAPYQAGFRPGVGEQVAWAESNAVVFANSVLGARTNRYGDFMDICCALTGYAPLTGLHLAENRRATLLVDLTALPGALLDRDDFHPVLGAWLGRAAGSEVAVIDGLPGTVSEDQLKALGASAASTGAVALFHAVGVTPEAATLEQALGGRPPRRTLRPNGRQLLAELRRLSTAQGDHLDVVALGSPHFSVEEFGSLLAILDDRRVRVPVYACTGRHVLDELERRGWQAALERAGVRLVLDTCVVVTPVIGAVSGILMTNSGKFAHYSPSLIRHEVVYGSLAECLESAVAGRVVRDPGAWGAV
jgi:predicted aconitase